MTARYLRTRFATDLDESQSTSEWLQRKLLFFIPKANPGYEPKLHEIEEWIVEFDADGLPHREIGLSASGAIVVAGPNDRDYGFWLDTNAN